MEMLEMFEKKLVWYMEQEGGQCGVRRLTKHEKGSGFEMKMLQMIEQLT